LLLTARTGRTFVAAHHRVDGDQLAGRESGHARAQLVDPADRLVPHHLTRMATAVLAGVTVEIRPADSGRDHLDDHLVRSRPGIGSLFHGDVVVAAQNQCLHLRLLS
jgi:hypothetical protein